MFPNMFEFQMTYKIKEQQFSPKLLLFSILLDFIIFNII